jgi:hypothetical protein
MKHGGLLGIMPTKDGLYAVEIHFGWKLLEWYAGAWWHLQRVGRWMADDPVQWGPSGAMGRAIAGARERPQAGV